ncbi:MAG: 50S ribosomal protein L11 methyltransferase [Planctomycetota bacterium]
MRRFRLRGIAPDLVAALDRIHVACEVAGAIEGDDELEVFIAGDALPPLDDLALAIEELDAQSDAARTGLEDDRAIEVSEHLLVRPPWIPRPDGFRGLDLVVPRGMAFGSGEHGSTQAALLALDRVWPTPSPRQLLDVGTGSGILALYAQRRGVVEVSACDVEPEAVDAARELLGDARVRRGGPEVFTPEVFVAVVANLDARQIDDALEAILARWSGSGPLVLSGMRPHEVDELRVRMPRSEAVRIERGGYVALAWPRRGSGA